MRKRSGRFFLRRSQLVLLCVLAQLLVLGAMAGKRELIRATGQEVYLRTAPIDPRDPFRGDFVRLEYPFSNVAPAEQRGTLAQHRDQKGHLVYAVLAPEARGLYRLDYLTDQQPASGVYLRGRLGQHWRAGQAGAVHVRYGIEQLFVEQGKGLAIEEKRGRRGQLQVPMEVQVALGGDGTAVIKGYRWSALGIQLEVLRFNRRGRNNELLNPDEPLSPRVRVTLENVSEGPLRVADPADPCAFRLEAVRWAPGTYDPAQVCATAQADGRMLAAGERIQVEIDLSEPRWHLRTDGRDDALEMGALPNPVQFRLIYRSRFDGAGEGQDGDAARWEGELSTQAFNALGQWD